MIVTHKLKEIYFIYKDDPNPPVPLKTIKEFLEDEGIDLSGKDDNKSQTIKTY